MDDPRRELVVRLVEAQVDAMFARQGQGPFIDDSPRTEEVPQPQGRELLVHYQPGEKGRLVEELLSRWEEGPVILWTPYAAASVIRPLTCTVTVQPVTALAGRVKMISSVPARPGARPA